MFTIIAYQPRGVSHFFAQNYPSLYVTTGTYDNEYLGYIFGPGDAPVIPPSIRRKAFLRVQGFGPFRP